VRTSTSTIRRRRIAAASAVFSVAALAGSWLAFAAVEGVATLSAERYDANDTPTLTVSDADLNVDSEDPDQAFVHLKSTVDPTGINVTLNETGNNTSVFTGTATFSTTTSNDFLNILLVATGNTVTLTYLDASHANVERTDTATMFANSATAALDQAAYTFPSTATLTVNDVDGNLNSGLVEALEVTLVSSSDPFGITVTLTETGVATGIFTGTADLIAGASSNANDELQVDSGDTVTLTYNEPLFNGTGTQPRTDTAIVETVGEAFFGTVLLGGETRYALADTANLVVDDGDLDTNPVTQQTVSVNVASTTDATGISVTLTETTVSSGVFAGDATFTTGASNDGSDILSVSTGDTVTLTYQDATPAAAITDTATMLVDDATATLDSERYRRTQTAGLQVADVDQNEDPSAAETVSVNLSSTADATGISVTLTETGADTSVFSGSATFVSGASSDLNDQLQVAAANTVTLRYTEPLFAGGTASRTDTATMFADTGSVTLDATVYALDDTATITATDVDGNLDSSAPDTVSATLSSTADGTGISVVLTETGAATGIFTGTATFEETLSDDEADILLIGQGDTVTATYNEPNFSGSGNLARTDTASVPTDGSITLDQPMYGIDDTASISVTDPDLNTDGGSAQSVSVMLASDSDGAGITVLLTETGDDADTFTGTAAFSDAATDDGNDVLLVAPSDALIATYEETTTFDGSPEDRTAEASMFAGNSTVDFDATTYSLDETATITVDDPEANENAGAVETVDVTVTSTSDGTGISVTLTESGEDTGTFVGTATFSDTASDDDADALLIGQGDGLLVEYVEPLFGGETEPHSDFAVIYSDGSLTLGAERYALTDTASISVADPDLNQDSEALETVDITLSSDSDATGIPVTLTEIAANVGIFQGTATFSETASDGGADELLAAPGDTVTGTYAETTTFDGPPASRTDAAGIDPVVTTADPSTLPRNVVGSDITVTGEGFADGAEASISGAGVTVNSTTFVSNTQLTVDVDIAGSAPVGSRDITVDNPNGGSGSCTDCFSVGVAIEPFDFDGNGGADLAVGVPGETVGGDAGAGGVNVIYSGSPLSGAGSQLWTQDSAGIASGARPGDLFGSAIASGDFNADGFADLAVGVPGERVGGHRRAGAVNVIYGSAAGLRAAGDQLWHQDSPGIGNVAEPGDGFGAALGAGDVNGDGFADLIVGVPGEGLNGRENAGMIHVTFGSASGLTAAADEVWHQNRSDIAGTVGAGDAFGSSLAVGDLDSDGFLDVAVGVPGETIGKKSGAGAVNVLYATSNGLAAAGNQLWSQGSRGINGKPVADEAFGFAVAIGDLNGNGIADLAVGVPGDVVDGKPGAGAVNVIFGTNSGLRRAGDKLIHQGSTGVRSPPRRDEAFGFSLAAGDIDGDGSADLAVGVPGETIGGDADAGAVQVLYGGAGFNGADDQLWHQDVSALGLDARPGEVFGFAVRIADYDGDGDADLAVGVPFERIGGNPAAGSASVIYSNGSRLDAAGSQRWRQGANGVQGTLGAGDLFGAAL